MIKNICQKPTLKVLVGDEGPKLFCLRLGTRQGCPLVFLYTSNKQWAKFNKKTISFIIASKRAKYLGIHLTKKVEDLYIENHKRLLKEIKEETNKCSLIGRFILKMCTLPKAIYGLDVISAKISMILFPEVEKSILKFLWISRNPKLQKQIWNQFLISKLTKSIVMKTVWYQHKERCRVQWNRMQDPEINPNIYDQIISTRVSRH